MEAGKRFARAGGRWKGLGSAEFTVTVPPISRHFFASAQIYPAGTNTETPLTLFLVPSLGLTDSYLTSI